jgi:predicted RNA binding protein YcfA (HicA-like mRNA interferase family)
MSEWPGMRARRVLAALQRIGWTTKRQTGSHRILARIAKHTGLRPQGL